MFIKRLDRVHYDIFIGDGWNNWTRVRRHHWGVSVVAGNRLQREAITEINKRIIK